MLASALQTVTPREKSGATTSSRFAFQAHVSLAKMLDLHDADTDFRALLDYYDDLTIFSDSTADPSEARFFQIKGKKSGSWTAAQLVKPEGKAPQTVVGKMYHHTAGFGASAAACTFVSNAPFSFTLSDGTKTTSDSVSVEFSALGKDDQDSFRKALDLDFKPPRSPDEASVLKFERTSVPLTDYEVFLRGRLVITVGDDTGIPVNALYRLLIEEITKRANDTSDCTTPSEIFGSKSFCRAELQSAISAAETRFSVLDHWAIIDEELKDASRSTKDRIRLRTSMISYVRARGKRDAAATALSAAARLAASQHVTDLDGTETLIAAGGVLQLNTVLPSQTPFSGLELEAAILVEAFEAIHG
ncbi:dsDNA nuclease domain-containing protein [Phenylobacterium sp.]|uniref:dsDNA nuclease domain-containing protein n=1 Tax=Phenylobacterium sp. TaxID=1871053 RepID=UPI0030F44029